MCSRFEHVLVFPWDYGELLLFTSSSLYGGELLSFKNEGYLLEIFFNRTLSINAGKLWNNAPNEIKEAKNINIAKILNKTYCKKCPFETRK